MVKVRYTTRCARCREAMLPGTVAMRFRGGLWHTACAVRYQREREQMLVAR